MRLISSKASMRPNSSLFNVSSDGVFAVSCLCSEGFNVQLLLPFLLLCRRTCTSSPANSSICKRSLSNAHKSSAKRASRRLANSLPENTVVYSFTILKPWYLTNFALIIYFLLIYIRTSPRLLVFYICWVF